MQFVCGFIFVHRVYVDVIGILSGIFSDREYVRDGKVTKMIVVELTDHRDGDCRFGFNFCIIGYFLYKICY